MSLNMPLHAPCKMQSYASMYISESDRSLAAVAPVLYNIIPNHFLIMINWLGFWMDVSSTQATKRHCTWSCGFLIGLFSVSRYKLEWAKDVFSHWLKRTNLEQQQESNLFGCSFLLPLNTRAWKKNQAPLRPRDTHVDLLPVVYFPSLLIWIHAPLFSSSIFHMSTCKTTCKIKPPVQLGHRKCFPSLFPCPSCSTAWP